MPVFIIFNSYHSQLNTGLTLVLGLGFHERNKYLGNYGWMIDDRMIDRMWAKFRLCMGVVGALHRWNGTLDCGPLCCLMKFVARLKASVVSLDLLALAMYTNACARLT